MSDAQGRFTDYMAGRSGSFFSCLFQAIFKADPRNLAKLAQGFPEEVECVKRYRGNNINDEKETQDE